MEHETTMSEQEFLGNVPLDGPVSLDQDRIRNVDAEVEMSWRAAENGGWHDSWHKLQSRIGRGEASPDEARNWVIGKLFLIIDEITEAGGELRNGHSFTEVYYQDVEGRTGVKGDLIKEQAYREGGIPLFKPEGFLVELADAVVRIEDLVGIVTEGSPSFGQIKLDKIAYNATRGQMHGGAKF
jgi:hypothetical protein